MKKYIFYHPESDCYFEVEDIEKELENVDFKLCNEIGEFDDSKETYDQALTRILSNQK